MKPTLALRIASVLTLVHAALHTVGGVFSGPDPGPAQVAFSAMQSNHFLVMGFTRTYSDFYLGLGLAVTIFLTVEAIVFWLLGNLAKSNPQRLRPILVVFLFAYLALAVNSWFNFFLGPVITEIAISIFLALAIFAAKPLSVPGP
jgi:hypothetical protein